MANFYKSIINTNISKNYFNSMKKYQKSEFNYTIAYYYNIQKVTNSLFFLSPIISI